MTIGNDYEFDGKQGSLILSGIFNYLSRKEEYLGYKKGMNFIIKIAWGLVARV
jgi:hypothetical protein